MWPNNEFGTNNGNNFNRDDYTQSCFAGFPGQQFFQPHPFQPNMMQLEGGNEEGLNGEFQPEIGLFNEAGFAQNYQFANPTYTKVKSSNLGPSMCKLLITDFLCSSRQPFSTLILPILQVRHLHAQ
jgi:hypothetical protein